MASYAAQPTAYAAQPTAYAAQLTAYAAQPSAYAAQPKIFVKVYFQVFQPQPDLFFQSKTKAKEKGMPGRLYTHKNIFHGQTPNIRKTHPRDFNQKN